MAPKFKNNAEWAQTLKEMSSAVKLLMKYGVATKFKRNAAWPHTIKEMLSCSKR